MTTFRFIWGNTPKRAALKDRECVIVSRRRGHALVRFLDTGETHRTNMRALRRVT